MIGWVGDEIQDLIMHLFADVDLGGCTSTSRATSGSPLCLLGKATIFPLSSLSKRQACVSHSTLDAEMAALSVALRKEGLLALEVWRLAKSLGGGTGREQSGGGTA